MKRKIIIINSIIVFIMLLLVFGLGVLVTKNNNLEYANEHVRELTKIYVNCYKVDPNFPINVNDIRVTIIDSAGKVLSDNFNVDVETMTNHLDREEIVSARNGKNKTVIRKSETLNRELIYYAEKVEIADGFVYVRVAVPIQTINGYVAKSIPLMACLLIVLFGVEAIVSIVLNTFTLKPLTSVKNGLQAINNGNFSPIMPAEQDEEINEIITQINELGEKLSFNINSLNFEKEKLDYILNHITNGVIALNQFGDVILVNDNALRFFDLSKQIIGKGFASITDSKVVLDSISKAINEKGDAIFDYENNERNYLITIKNTEKDYIILVIADVTDSRKNEKLRSEFFANASHELKTPLTSLCGFNELALLQEKDETIKSYLLQMDKDLQRVLVLIEDMLKLSKLEHTKAENIVKVDVLEIANEIIEELQPKIIEKALTVEIVGSGEVNANKDDIFVLQKNLIENAVHYSDKGGKIVISINNELGKTKFTVKDNGIGIDSVHHARVFERFYRVEKSRSRATGGTGLGLSIVKHIAERYNATISLDSKIGVGTTISILF